MIAITKKPIANITGDASNVSKWTSAHQPVEFEVQRKDYQNISLVGKKTVNGVVLTIFRIEYPAPITDIKVNDSISFICGPDDNRRAFSLIVKKLDYNVNNKLSYIYFDLNNVIDAYKVTAYKAYIHANRKGYYIETFVYLAATGQSMELAGVVKSKTDLFGVSKVNIHKVISSNLSNENKNTYTKINEAQANQGAFYNVKIREVYDGYIGEFTKLLGSDNLFYVNGSKQLQDENNFNFGEFVPTLNDSRVNKAKFLSVFNRPTYFNGYPFDLSFIYSDNLENKQIQRSETNIDVNGVNGTPTLTNLLTNGRGYVNRLQLTGSYSSSVKVVSVHLESGSNTTQNPSTGGGTYATVGTIFNPYQKTIEHSLKDLNTWTEAFNQNLRPITENRYE
jgi:hypothetical protein